MKRIVIIALAIFALLCSCTKNDPEHLILGNWEETQSIMHFSDGTEHASTYSPRQIVYSFDSDGICTIQAAHNSIYTYEVTDRFVVMKQNNSKYTYYYRILALDKNEMRLKWDSDAFADEMIFKRIK